MKPKNEEQHKNEKQNKENDNSTSKPDVSPDQHTGKEVNRERSQSKKDLEVKNEVTGANLDAPAG